MTLMSSILLSKSSIGNELMVELIAPTITPRNITLPAVTAFNLNKMKNTGPPIKMESTTDQIIAIGMNTNKLNPHHQLFSI